MMNDLFNQTLMRKYAKDFKLTPSVHDLIVKHIQKLDEGQFEAETKNYIYFYEVWLKGILGYDLDENVLFDEKEEHGMGKSEFILKSGDKKFMVVELKGQKSDLDKPQNRVNDKRTPVSQAFDYAQHTGDIDWIVVSNYDEFRLYNWHQKGKYISFKSKELLDKETFAYFMLAFSKESHINNDYISKLMDKTLIIERSLEKEFYKLYNETRLMLIKEFEEINKCSRLDSIHYAQMIMNRYMFICFGEDMDLLPAQISTDTILTPIQKGNIRRGSIWQRLNELFLDINEGNEFKGISEYNGGLFQEDLEKIHIRDLVDDQNFFNDVYQDWKFEEYEKETNSNLGPYGNKVNPIYRNLLTISTFDFSTELDVNILGHIFENSIGDIEELKEGSKGRRKKDGIFYTPNYITDYICENTIIPYLSKSGNVNNVDDLIEEYWGSEIYKLDDKVKKIKILDPACGSGAFLNKAVDILIDIHVAIHIQKYKRKQNLIPFFDNIGKRREILLNNIFGVDLNQESVEITKLSLFLKVCRNGLKLPNLDKNIKCGNSLINDSKFTDKPFNWDKEFSKINEEGGFDIVIGNPPYVRQERIKEIKPYLKENYETYTGVADLYVYFFEKGVKILKPDGKLGYISSNKFIKSNYGKKLREFIMKNTSFKSYVDHTWDKVFEGATVHSSVFIIQKGFNKDNTILVDNDFELKQSRLSISSWSFERPEILDLRDKINNNGTFIKDIPNLEFYRGLISGYNDAYVLNENTKEKLIKKDPKSIEIIKPLLRGRDIKRWKINYQNLYLILIGVNEGQNLEKNYPAIYNHLKQFEKQLKNRAQVKRGDHHWLEIDNNPSKEYLVIFEENKIIYPNIAPSLFAVFDSSGYYTNQKCFVISSKTMDLKYLTALMSSKTLNFIFKFLGSTLEGKRFDLNKKYIEQLPINLITNNEQEPFIEKVDMILNINKDLIKELNGFKGWLKRTYNIDSLSQKLDKYFNLSFDDFLSELTKKKINIKDRKSQELLKKEFEESINKINPLIKEIENTDNEINKLVYELYGLSDDEIKIVEESLNS